MDYPEMLKRARTAMEGHCSACPECDGVACGSRIPGPGAKGSGDVARRNFDAWRAVRVQMDTITDMDAVDTSWDFLGRNFAAPILAGPVGAVDMHYGSLYDDLSYDGLLVPACAEAGIAAFTGDGMDPRVMESASETIGKVDGKGIPTVKPWSDDIVAEKLELVRGCGAFAVAMDVDAAGLPFLKGMTPPAGNISVRRLTSFVQQSGRPFIVKGVMTPDGALKAMEAGASAIVVSNHGGRVLDQCRATAEVLPEIVRAVDGGMRILVDGGIRTGVDVFKAIALGADGVLIARPYVVAVYGGGAEGVALYTERLMSELADTMAMCGAFHLTDITPDMVWRGWESSHMGTSARWTSLR